MNNMILTALAIFGLYNLCMSLSKAKKEDKYFTIFIVILVVIFLNNNLIL